MPLIKSSSKQAFKKNVETEMKANPGKRAQNLAIAYSVMRKNKGKKKMMAEGGEARAGSYEADSDSRDSREMEMLDSKPMSHMDEQRAGVERSSADSAKDHREMDMLDGRYSTHGDDMTSNEESMSGNSIDDSMDSREMDMTRASSKMHDPRAKMMHGGEIDLRDEKMTTVDDASSMRDMDMLDSKPRRHKDEKRAGVDMPSADDAGSIMDEGMLHTKNDPDEYSKKGIINYAKGGNVRRPRLDEMDERPRSISDAIRAKKMMAEGGSMDGDADLDRNADEDLNYEDQLSYRAGRQQNYDEQDALDSVKYSSKDGTMGHEDEDENDLPMVDKIRKSMKSRR